MYFCKKILMSSIITLTGDLGSGKSTVSKQLIKKLGYDYIYTGAIQRKIAERYNMSTTELNIYAETHPEIDDEIDSIFKNCNNSENLIIDSRLAWFFVPNSFKVFLKTNIVVAVDRIIRDKLRKNEVYCSKDEAIKKITERKNSENKRYLDYYGADPTNMSNYNLIIDTTYLSVERLCDLILDNYAIWQKDNNYKAVFLSPKNIFPTKNKKEYSEQEKFSEKILLINHNNNDFIIDGHQIVETSLKNKEKLITNIEYVNDTFFDEKINISTIQLWEKDNNFNFLFYPNKN